MYQPHTKLEWKMEDGQPCVYFACWQGGDAGCVARYTNTETHGWWQLYEFDNGPEGLLKQSTNIMDLIEYGESLT
jgi:hypothetical protein